MATIDRDILTITEPTIPLDELAVEDKDSDEALEDSKGQQATDTLKQDTQEGGLVPVVQINSIKVSPDELELMELQFNDFLPTATFVIKDVSDKMSDIQYPLDGDVVSVYLKPRPVEEYRPLRIDYDIVSISSSPREGSEPAAFTFNCVMKVPLLYADVVQGFSSGNSFDHLIDCAEGLGLGFASNEDSTDDPMNRICANQSREEFIRHTTLSAYKDDESFFTSYIDPHYYLCFVNINKQFSEVDELEPAPVIPQIQTDLQVPSSGSEGEPEEVEGSLRLSNGPDVQGSNMAITSYNLVNNSGDIWLQNGYARKVKYLNLNENINGADNGGLEEFLITPLNTPGSDSNRIPMRGRIGEDYWRNNNKNKYIGKQPSEDFGNVHSNFMYAIGNNFGNSDEIKKMIMEIELEVVNWTLYRYQRIPILIYTKGEQAASDLETRDAQLGENEESPNADSQDGNLDNTSDDEATGAPNKETKNEFLSGFYVISEMTYKYNIEDKKIRQSLKLLRREWPIPGKLQTN